ncbi:MAG: hypothetical protein HVN35_10330 [Methanobacteriaceae archaeon]|nr:hypothetical protein [Methanobacteriaceae archaeon]
MKSKLKALENLGNHLKGLKNKIATHKHHKLILGIFTIFCLFLVVLIPTYNAYSVEEAPITEPVTQQVLGNESYGTVIKEGPYGNCSSSIKVAYIIGQHPREYRAHKAIAENVKEQSSSLKKCYYLYYINVTQYASDFSKGRMNGQLLSKEYVVPSITSEKFSLAIDVHGTDGEYSKKVFLFTPIPQGASMDIAYNLSNTVKGVPYYYAPNPTSTRYTTLPLINNGIPALVYESFTDLPYNVIKEQNREFILGVDNLILKPNPCY